MAYDVAERQQAQGTARQLRCRYMERDNSKCPNPSLDQDFDAPMLICIKHAAMVIALLRHQQARIRGAVKPNVPKGE